MPCCAVLECKNKSWGPKVKSDHAVTFHRFPKEPDTKLKWIEATGRQNWFPTKMSTICSEHFHEHLIITKKGGRRHLCDAAIPEKNVLYFQVRTYQPTYRLNPKKKFSLEAVQRLLESIVTAELQEVEYNDKLIPELCLTLADSIRSAVKDENYDRCRVLVSVTIGQRRLQGVQMYHSFLWDHERDNYAVFNFENCHVFANAVVYLVYLD